MSDIQQTLGHTFADPNLLQKALTHSSIENVPSYERLEFLGDSILGLAIAEHLYKNFPKEPEGMLSKRLSSLVRKETLALIAKQWELSPHIQIGSGELEADGSIKDSILADVVEALIAAIYLEEGMDKVNKLIKNFWLPLVHKVRLKDGKSELQERLQAEGLPLPTYTVIKEEGQDHNKTFTIKVSALGQTATGQGGSKQKAEQAAADALLENLNDNN